MDPMESYIKEQQEELISDYHFYFKCRRVLINKPKLLRQINNILYELEEKYSKHRRSDYDE